jgi:hypothetical protein
VSSTTAWWIAAGVIVVALAVAAGILVGLSLARRGGGSPDGTAGALSGTAGALGGATGGRTAATAGPASAMAKILLAVHPPS